MKTLFNSRNLTLLTAAFGLFATTNLAAQDTGHPADRASDATTEAPAEKTAGAMDEDAEVTTVELTQTPGEFETQHLDLAPGQYQFDITNDGVDHEVGFVIQRAEDVDGDVMETALENSFSTSPIAPGATVSTGVVTLEPGEYVYSCPLNPTPHYTITVE